MRPRSIGTSSKLAPGVARTISREPGELVRLDVDEEIAGARSARRVSISPRDCPRPARPRPERLSPSPSESTIRARRRPRPVQIGERQPQQRPPRPPPADPARRRDDRQRRRRGKGEGGDRAADKPQRDLAVGRGQHNAGQRARAQRRRSPRPRRAAAGARRRRDPCRETARRARRRAIAASGHSEKTSVVKHARTAPRGPAAPGRARGATTTGRDRGEQRRRRPPAPAPPSSSPRAIPTNASARIWMKIGGEDQRGSRRRGI